MKKITFLSIFLLMVLFNSCHKESEKFNIEQKLIVNTSEINDFTGNITKPLLNLNFDKYSNFLSKNVENEKDDNIYIPTYEMLLEVEKLILAQDSIQPFLIDFMEEYGSINWNYSFIKEQDNLSFISIPFIKNGELTGVLKFYKLDNHREIRFVSKIIANEIVAADNFAGDIHLMKGSIRDLIILDYNINQYVNIDYMDWLNLRALQNIGSNKGLFWCITTITDWYQYTGDGVDWEYLDSTSDTECFYSSTGYGNLGNYSSGNTYPNDWPGNGGNNNNDDFNNNNNNHDDNDDDDDPYDEEAACLAMVNTILSTYSINSAPYSIKKQIASECCEVDGIGLECAADILYGNDLDALTLAENGFLVSKTCESSFNYNPIGNGFTCEVTNITHAYLSTAGFFDYKIPVTCIQVSGTDAFGTPLTPSTAAALTAFAIDNARLALLNLITEGSIFTDLQAQNEFKLIFSQELSTLTGGQTTSSLSFGPCSGNISSQAYALNPLGGNTFCYEF